MSLYKFTLSLLIAAVLFLACSLALNTCSTCQAGERARVARAQARGDARVARQGGNVGVNAGVVQFRSQPIRFRHQAFFVAPAPVQFVAPAPVIVAPAQIQGFSYGGGSAFFIR